MKRLVFVAAVEKKHVDFFWIFGGIERDPTRRRLVFDFDDVVILFNRENRSLKLLGRYADTIDFQADHDPLALKFAEIL